MAPVKEAAPVAFTPAAASRLPVMTPSRTPTCARVSRSRSATNPAPKLLISPLTPEAPTVSEAFTTAPTPRRASACASSSSPTASAFAPRSTASPVCRAADSSKSKITSLVPVRPKDTSDRSRFNAPSPTRRCSIASRRICSGVALKPSAEATASNVPVVTLKDCTSSALIWNAILSSISLTKIRSPSSARVAFVASSAAIPFTICSRAEAAVTAGEGVRIVGRTSTTRASLMTVPSVNVSATSTLN